MTTVNGTGKTSRKGAASSTPPGAESERASRAQAGGRSDAWEVHAKQRTVAPPLSWVTRSLDPLAGLPAPLKEAIHAEAQPYDVSTQALRQIAAELDPLLHLGATPDYLAEVVQRLVHAHAVAEAIAAGHFEWQLSANEVGARLDSLHPALPVRLTAAARGLEGTLAHVLGHSVFDKPSRETPVTNWAFDRLRDQVLKHEWHRGESEHFMPRRLQAARYLWDLLGFSDVTERRVSLPDLREIRLEGADGPLPAVVVVWPSGSDAVPGSRMAVGEVTLPAHFSDVVDAFHFFVGTPSGSREVRRVPEGISRKNGGTAYFSLGKRALWGGWADELYLRPEFRDIAGDNIRSIDGQLLQPLQAIRTDPARWAAVEQFLRHHGLGDIELSHFRGAVDQVLALKMYPTPKYMGREGVFDRFSDRPRARRAPPPQAASSAVPRQDLSVLGLDARAVTGVPPDEAKANVKAAFRALAKKLHPDVSKLPKAEAEAKFKALNDANERLMKWVDTL